MPVIRIEGLDELLKELHKKADKQDIRQVVKQNGSELQTKSKRNAERFKGHYEWVRNKGRVFVKPTGTLRDSIGLEIIDGGMTAEVEPTAEYAAYVEYGTRFMESQPYMRPAFNAQKRQFKKDLEKLMK